MLDFRLRVRDGDPQCWLPAPADREEVVVDDGVVVVEDEGVVDEAEGVVVVVEVGRGLWDGQLIQVICLEIVECSLICLLVI